MRLADQPSSPKRWRAALITAAAVFLFLAGGCAGDMSRQPKYLPLEPSSFFSDSRSARPVIDETVPWGEAEETRLLLPEDEEFQQIVLPGDDEAVSLTAFPFPVTTAIIERGQEQYDIYCSPCHGLAGYGDGLVVQRGFPAPTSFHEERLRQAPVGHYYNAITNGFGRMFSYAYRVEPFNRWAIIAYIRALQLSQNTPIESLPPEILEELEAGP